MHEKPNILTSPARAVYEDVNDRLYIKWCLTEQLCMSCSYPWESSTLHFLTKSQWSDVSSLATSRKTEPRAEYIPSTCEERRFQMFSWSRVELMCKQQDTWIIEYFFAMQWMDYLMFSLLCSSIHGCELPGVNGHAAGYRVPDAGASAWVSRFHYDKGPLLQCDHSKMLGVIQGLQERAIARPGVIP